MKTYLLSLIFLFVTVLNAQLNPNTKWGKVSQEEIDYKQVTFEKEAPAVVLYEEGKTTISGAFRNSVYRRIKILDEKGIEFANQELPYYSFKNLEQFGNIKAQTINIENGKPVIHPVDKKDIFDVTVNEYYNSKKFTFPNVKVGSIIEFEYEMQDEKLYLIDAWRFQHELPTLYSAYKVSNESNLDYTSLMIGEKTVSFSKKKNNKDINNWILTNIPSFKTLSYLYNPEDMSERIAFQLVGYYGTSGNFYGGSTYKDAIKSWKDLCKEMENDYKSYSNESFVKNLSAAIPQGKDELETLKNVYDYFSRNYKWNRFMSIYPRISNRDMEKERSGTVADLNLMLNSFLKTKGFDAKLILLSTRSNGKIITSYPYLGQFNAVINLVTLSDGSSYLIDGSYMKHDLGFMPLRNYNHFGLVIGETGEFIGLKQPVSEFNSVQLYAMKDGKFNLVRTDKINGYFKQTDKEETKGVAEINPVLNAMDILMNETKTETKNSDGFEMNRSTFESSPLNNVPFINIENPLKQILQQYTFSEEIRERNLEFNFPFYYKTDIVINIPEGYSAEIPANFKASNEVEPKELLYFQKAEIKEDKLVLHVEFYMGKAIFSEKYTEIKSFFEKSNLDASKAILLKRN